MITLYHIREHSERESASVYLSWLTSDFRASDDLGVFADNKLLVYLTSVPPIILHSYGPL